MQDIPFFALIMGGLVLGFGALQLFSRRQEDRRASGSMVLFAQKHGLTLTSPTEASGVYQQRALQLRRELRKVPGHRSRYPVTVVRFDVSDALPPAFSLQRAGAGDTLADLVGGRGDEKMGAEGFDNAFSLANVSPETREVLGTTAVLEHCWSLNENEEFHIQHGWLHTELRESPESVEALEGLVDAVLETPRALATAAASIRARKPA